MANVKLSRYKNFIILYALYIVFWFALIAVLRFLFFPEGSPIALTRFIPFNDALIELAIVFVLIIPISGLIGTNYRGVSNFAPNYGIAQRIF